MNIKIRKAKEMDMPAIIALHSEIDISNEESISVQNATIIFSRILTYPNYHIYVALIRGEIVGTFALLIMDNLAHNGAPSGIVEDVAVKRELHGKGIGKQMEYSIIRCREAGCYKMTLSSNSIRKRAHRFYESLGFKKHGYSFLVDIV